MRLAGSCLFGGSLLRSIDAERNITMKKDRIAAQLYTLREFLKTPADIAESLKKVKKAGLDAVQISGMGPIDLDELNKILDGEGVVCCATHESGADII